MKKSIFLITMMVMISIFSLVAVAENDADVIFSLSSESVHPGEQVTLTLSMTALKDTNSVAVTYFEYDTDVLEFVGFDNYDSLGKLCVFPPNFDENLKAIVFGLKKSSTYSIDICSVVFRVKDNAPEGDFSVSATGVAKNSSIVYTTAFNKGIVNVTMPEPVQAEGTSLILDGSIGLKTYISIDDTRVALSDVAVQTEVLDKNISHVISKTENTVSNGIGYDESKGLYYIVVYISPKDADNFEVKHTLHYTYNGDSVVTEGESLTVTSYIKEFKSLAEENPDSDFGKGIDLVEAIDVYTKYADNYFSNDLALDTVEVDIVAINSVSSPVLSGAVSDIQFFATSLVLEDKTTLRHYFKATDDAVAKHTFKIGDKVLEPKRKNDSEYVYVDISDIPADCMDESYVLSVSGKMDITFSVLNYVKLAVTSDDAKMQNLMKALYNYYYQASSYVTD